MQAKSRRPLFLLSFIPATVYWLLETYFTLEIALIGGVLLGIAEMIIEKKYTGHIHTLSKLNISLIVVLGSISLIAKEGVFFKLQPTFTGYAVASFLLYKRLQGQSLMLEMMKDLHQIPPLPPAFYQYFEWHFCLFTYCFASFMCYVALNESTSTWLFWKTGGFYIIFGIFVALEMFYMRFFLRSKMQ